MSGKTKIEWCDKTWPVVTGCSPVEAGCENCWAARLAATRLKHHPRYRGLAEIPPGREGKARWTGKVRCHAGLLDMPLHWRKPCRIFVAPQGDLFHECVPQEFIAQVFLTTFVSAEHTYLVLTKRAERMRQVINDLTEYSTMFLGKPLPNVWLGFSAEDQETFDKRWQRVRPLAEAGWKVWASLEPLLTFIVLPEDYLRLARWTVTGGESGPGARPSHPDWFRKVRDYCQAAGVPFFFKQWGNWTGEDPKDGTKPTHLMCSCGLLSERSGDPIKTLHDCREFSTSKWWNLAHLGKKRAGRLLDGREWNEFPKIG